MWEERKNVIEFEVGKREKKENKMKKDDKKEVKLKRQQEGKKWTVDRKDTKKESVVIKIKRINKEEKKEGRN